MRLCIIRVILILALTAVAAWFHFYLVVELPWNALLPLMTAVLALTLLVFWRLRFDWPVGETEFFANLLLDVAFLSILLYFTGGSTNPLVSYFLIPLIISAAVLRPGFTWIIAILSITLYTLLLFHFQSFSLFEIGGHQASSTAHFLGMWVNFGFSALLISWFVVRMAETLRENEKEIARSRETSLRNERIIGVANIAAGAAHELRTPLSTMAILAQEISEDHPEVREQAGQLQRQVERCDSILRELVSTATDAGQKKPVRVVDVFGEVLEKWNLSRPEISLQISISDEASGLHILYDQSLVHALINLLNNAAEASPESVVFRADVHPSGGGVLIVVEDRGPGIPSDVAGQLGKSPVTGTPGGLGLGALLSQASIERLGGTIEMVSKPRAGTRLEIHIPLHDT